MLVFEERGKLEYPKKDLGAKERTNNKLKTMLELNFFIHASGYKGTWYTCRSAIAIQEQHTIIGSFSIDNGDGSEYVTFKTNWHFFKICCV